MSSWNGKRIRQKIWLKWERIIGLAIRWRSHYQMQMGICTLLVKKHKGKSVHCSDGTCIRDGDWVGELHLNNAEIMNHLTVCGSERSALRVARRVRDSLEQIYEAMGSRSELKQVKALVGITLLHRGIIHGLGFELQPIESKSFRWMSTHYLRLLMFMLHPDGKERLDRRTEQLVPMLLIHTRNTLMERFDLAHRSAVSRRAIVS